MRKHDCGDCGQGKAFKDCCQQKPEALRPAWNEKSIRERNLMLQNGIVNIMELEPGKDWVQVRRELTDDKIAKIYHLYEGLWPLETDLLALLPKPDGEARAVYSGSIHPSSFNDFAIAALAVFRRAHRIAPVRQLRRPKKGDAPDREPEAVPAGVREDGPVLPERHAARRLRLG